MDKRICHGKLAKEIGEIRFPGPVYWIGVWKCTACGKVILSTIGHNIVITEKIGLELEYIQEECNGLPTFV